MTEVEADVFSLDAMRETVREVLADERAWLTSGYRLAMQAEWLLAILERRRDLSPWEAWLTPDSPRRVTATRANCEASLAEIVPGFSEDPLAALRAAKPLLVERGLTPQQRRVLLLRFGYQLSTVEAASRLGVTTNAVRVAQRQAIKKLTDRARVAA